jgi:hypothetical protein
MSGGPLFPMSGNTAYYVEEGFGCVFGKLVVDEEGVVRFEINPPLASVVELRVPDDTSQVTG